jgi:hypothetical protein
VGLVQNEIEKAGISTVTLSSIPDLTASVGVPRLAAIEFPLGYLIGPPGDRETQRLVIESTLALLEEAMMPGTVKHVPLDWPEPEGILELEPPAPAPIVNYLLKHPLQIKDFFKRRVPAGW